MTTKVCTKCGVKKSLDDYHKRSAAPDGKCPHCKNCGLLMAAKFREKNHELLAKRMKEYRSENRDYTNALGRAWHDKNKEKRNAECRVYRGKNPGIMRNSTKNWIMNNIEQYRFTQKAYRQKHKEHYRVLHRVSSKKGRDDLTDSYIKGVLTKKTDLSAKDIPPALVELKRLQIAINRELKQGKTS